MLRASISKLAATELTPEPIMSGCGPTGVAHDQALLAFTDAVVLTDGHELPEARARLEILTSDRFADRAAMIAGNFSMMNRALDAVGAPVNDRLAPLAAEMGVSVPNHLRG